MLAPDNDKDHAGGPVDGTITADAVTASGGNRGKSPFLPSVAA
jgi:hypothetical protein